MPRKTGETIQRNAFLLTENFHITGLLLKHMDKLAHFSATPSQQCQSGFQNLG